MKRTNKFSDITLEKYLLEETTSELKKRIDKEMETDTELKARISEIKRSDAEISAKYNMKKFAAETEKKLSLKKKEKITFYIPKPAAVFLLLILILGGFSFFGITDSEKKENLYTENIRIKGTERIILYKLNKDKIELMENGSCAEESDLIQIGYSISSEKYGTILSVDGNNNITIHFPINTNESEKMTVGTKTLPVSYQLDNAPEFERFIMITSSEPFSVAEVKERLYNLSDKEKGKINLSFENSKTDFMLKKKIGGCNVK